MRRKAQFLDLPRFDRYKAEILAEAFELSAKRGYDSIDFVTKVMTSKKVDEFFDLDDRFEWADRYVLLHAFEYNLKLKKGRVAPEYAMWFLGYTLKYWMLTWSMKHRSEILEVMPVEWFLNNFEYLHTQDYEAVIKSAIQIYKQNRKRKDS